LSPGAFKRRYSEQLTGDLAAIKRVESIVAERRAKQEPSKDKEDSAPSDKVSTVKENAIDSPDPEKIEYVEYVESDESDESDAIGELDVSDDVGQENTPAN
jgi:hypothetical protein